MKNINILTQNSFFKDLESDILEVFSHNARLVSFDKGKLLFQQEEQADYFYLIQQGWVKLFKQTLDGTEAIIDVINKTHIFGERALFNNHLYSCSAEVIEAANLIVIPLNILEDVVSSTPQVALKMLKVMAVYRKRQEIELENRDIKNAPQRIGCFLMRLYPSTYDKKEISLILPYDKTLIASRLGMKAETFSRALHKLKEHTNITIKGSTITIPDIGRIEQYVCSLCSSTFPCDDL